jgi:cytochrome b561
MPALVILLSAAAFAAAVFIFGHAKPDWLGDSGAPWVAEPQSWQDMIDNRTWIMLLIFAALFVVYAILMTRRASANFWFFALAASSFPALAALLSLRHFMRAVKNAIDPNNTALDAGGDWRYWVALSAHVHVLSIALCFILAGMATYGYFARRKI